MKFLLIRPFFAIEKFYFPKFINESLAVESLSAFLGQYHSIRVIDAVAEGWNNYWGLSEYPETIFQGLKPEKLLKIVSDFNPEIIGLTWLFSTQNNSIEFTTRTIRKFNKTAPIVVGGSQPSANPAQILKENKNIDIVVYGEGEITMKELLDNKAKNLDKIKGIAFRKNDKIIVNPAKELIENLDSLPLPDRLSIPYKNYSKQNLYETIFLKIRKGNLKEKTRMRIAAKLSSFPFLANVYYKIYNRTNHKKLLPSSDIITSRGCPNHCTFCAIHNIWQHRWRMRSAQNVLEEIDYLVHKLGVRHLNFQDDNFNVSKERTIEICKGIIKNKYKITILAPSGAFVPTLDEEVLTWLKRAGLNDLRMSIESGDQNILDDVIKKNIDLSKVKNIVDICKKLRIETEGAFIFGIPGETIETMQHSLDFAKKTGFDRIVKFIFQPFPNTELYDICVKKNYLTKDYNPKSLYVTGNKCYVKTDKFSPEDVLRIVNR
jgi:anaerobic magnesium-protoporphyrin IX monomethyl ester cyclase